MSQQPADATTLDTSGLEPVSATPSRRRRSVRTFLRHRGAIVGLCLLAGLVLMALAAPLIAPSSPTEQAIDRMLQPPGDGHLMGTDDLGRDVFSRVVYGSRISLRIGLTAVGLGLGVGVVLGLVAGYFGRWVDTVIMRVVDIALAFPGILLALVVIAVLGPGINNVMVALGIAIIPIFVRVVRGSVLSAREQLYVEAARGLGAGDLRIVFRYVLPNIVGPVLVVATIQLANALLVAAAVSFLGLGAQPPSPEWGAMLAAGRAHLRLAWWLTVFPGVAIAITVLSINLIGDGLRDALDPRSLTKSN